MLYETYFKPLQWDIPILFAAALFVAALISIQKVFVNQPIINQSSTYQRTYHRHTLYHLMGIAIFSNAILMASMHSYLSLVMVCIFTGLQTLKHWRHWLLVAITCAISNGFLYFAYYGINETQGFIRWAPLALVAYSKLNLLPFLWANYGLFIPLFIIGFIGLKQYKQPLVVSGLGLFLVGYIIQFQPWIWDNTKILTWAYLLMIPAVLMIISTLVVNSTWSKRLVYVPVALILVVSLTLSASLDLWNLVKPNNQQYTMFTAEEIKLAKRFKQLTTSDDIVLTHTNHANWVHALASRPVFKAYDGWLGSYGIDSNFYKHQAKKILKGNRQLLQHYNIKYIVINKYHKPSDYSLEFLLTLRVLIQTPRYVIYQLK